MIEIANCSLHTVDRYCTQCTVHSAQWTMHNAQCTQVTFGLSLSSSLHLLSQLRKPVGYEESCVDEPANTVVQAGFLPAGKAAAWGPYAQVPAHLCCLVQLLHDLHLLLCSTNGFLNTCILPRAKLKLAATVQTFAIEGT